MGVNLEYNRNFIVIIFLIALAILMLLDFNLFIEKAVNYEIGLVLNKYS